MKELRKTWILVSCQNAEGLQTYRVVRSFGGKQSVHAMTLYQLMRIGIQKFVRVADIKAEFSFAGRLLFELCVSLILRPTESSSKLS
jgi:hypothetical protein